MTLPNATLFPLALLPLYIFEPRYRQMLKDVLHSHRFFAVAMQKPGTTREIPAPVAGIGMVRVCVTHTDGTSHLILQGISRVELQEAVRYKPYRLQKIRPLATPPCDEVRTDPLVARVKELLQERVNLGLPFPYPVMSPSDDSSAGTTSFSAKDVLKYLDSISDAEQAVDLVSCAVLPEAADRQAILETTDVETRLRQLIRYLIKDMKRNKKGNS